ncbi:MAG: hypothetical protein R3E97_17665 [Candidatus Eisenbacteria bacterium]
MTRTNRTTTGTNSSPRVRASGARNLALLLGSLFLLASVGCGKESPKGDSGSGGATPTPETTGSAPGDGAAPGSGPAGGAGELQGATGTVPGGDDAGLLTPELLRLLGSVQSDDEVGFEFRPPVVFERAADNFVEQARRALAQTPGSDGPYFTLPRMIFAVPGTEARIFVGEFAPETEPVDEEAWVAGYVAAAESKAVGTRFLQDRLEFAGQELLFVRIESGSFRNDRVVLRTRKGARLQVDYLLPAVSLPDIEDAVVASIATIRSR